MESNRMETMGKSHRNVLDVKKASSSSTSQFSNFSGSIQRVNSSQSRARSKSKPLNGISQSELFRKGIQKMIMSKMQQEYVRQLSMISKEDLKTFEIKFLAESKTEKDL
jgi:hypothetical protein